MRGYIPASRVQFKSLGGGGGPIVISGLQCHMRDRTDSQGAVQVSQW